MLISVLHNVAGKGNVNIDGATSNKAVSRKPSKEKKRMAVYVTSVPSMLICVPAYPSSRVLNPGENTHLSIYL